MHTSIIVIVYTVYAFYMYLMYMQLQALSMSLLQIYNRNKGFQCFIGVLRRTRVKNRYLATSAYTYT